jgi:tetratricopeptide (TPR) repeat protein
LEVIVIHLLMILLALSMPLRLQSDAVSVATQANAAYLSGDYQTAAQLYESLVESGLRNPTIYFNLGNAYYHLKDSGRAMLNYRRVQLFWPRDDDLNRNLRRVVSERIDLLGDETGFLEGLAASTINIVSLIELSSIVGLLWSVSFGMAAVAILRKDWGKRLRLPLIVVGCTLFIGLVLLGSRLFINNARPAGVVVDETAQVMSGPGETYLGLYQIHSGADVHIWDWQNGWVKFALPDGRMGWLPQDSVGVVEG